MIKCISDWSNEIINEWTNTWMNELLSRTTSEPKWFFYICTVINIYVWSMKYIRRKCKLMLYNCKKGSTG